VPSGEVIHQAYSLSEHTGSPAEGVAADLACEAEDGLTCGEVGELLVGEGEVNWVDLVLIEVGLGRVVDVER
jgi:hypothetical protein